MKKSAIVIGIIVVIGFSFIACGDPEEGATGGSAPNDNTPASNRYRFFGDFGYYVTKTGIEIEAYRGSGGAVTIPSAIEGLPVTTINDYAFMLEKLTSVTIPNSVTTIKEHAFIHNKLTSITIPNSVTTIGKEAFAYNDLASVIISNSITTIEEGSFSHNELTSVTIPNSVITIGKEAFRFNKLVSIIIPDSVTSIGHAAFHDYKDDLTSVTIGSNVTMADGNIFSSYFDSAYDKNGKQKGTYKRSGPFYGSSPLYRWTKQ